MSQKSNLKQSLNKPCRQRQNDGQNEGISFNLHDYAQTAEIEEEREKEIKILKRL